MIQVPVNFVQISKAPGYYWNVADKRLYSMKVTGVLKPMKLSPAYRGPVPGGGYVDSPAGYKISVNGNRRKIPYQWLCNVKVPDTTQVVPVQGDEK